MFVLIGSRAAQQLGILERMRTDGSEKQSDWDFLATDAEVKNWYKDYKHIVQTIRFKKKPDRYLCILIDGAKLCFDVDEGSGRNFYFFAGNLTKQFNQFVDNNNRKAPSGQLMGTRAGIKYITANAVQLMLLKRSHLTVSRNWRKHIEDYHEIRKYVEQQKLPIPINHLEAFNQRVKEVGLYNPSKVNLNKSNDEFFEESEKSVQRIFEHDDIHKAIMYYDEPLYDKFKTDKSKAVMSKELFFAAPLIDQQRTVREETYVIALERYIIPMMKGHFPVLAENEELPKEDTEFVQEVYLKALERICTTLTKGWFRNFAIEQYLDLKKPDVDFVRIFLDNVAFGKIKRRNYNGAS